MGNFGETSRRNIRKSILVCGFHSKRLFLPTVNCSGKAIQMFRRFELIFEWMEAGIGPMVLGVPEHVKGIGGTRKRLWVDKGK
jgi:hypothetical protein